MKLRKLLYWVLRVFNYCLGFTGVILFIGSVGSLELFTITFGQFFIQEVFAIGLIFLTFIVYNIRRTNFDYYFFEEEN